MRFVWTSYIEQTSKMKHYWLKNEDLISEITIQ